MSMHTPFVAGFLTGLTLIVAIGAQNSFVLRQGIRREHRLPITLICALSDAVLIVAGIAGLGALIQASPGLLTATRLGGAGFLLTYGFLAARRAWRGGQQCRADDASTTRIAAVTACLGFTFLNPHVYLDTVVLLGALANQQGEAGRWVFGGGAASASVFWFVSLAYGAGRLAPVFRNPAAWRLLDSLIALIMIGLAIELLRGLGG
jgi:L-lysine exporter family protein LysE/ArgO